MSNQSNPNKTKLQVWADKDLVAQIDGVAAKKKVSRSAVVVEAIKRYLDDTGELATKADLVAMAAALEKAIQNQPIAIQEHQAPALPAADEKPEELKNMSWWQFRKWKRGQNG